MVTTSMNTTLHCSVQSRRDKDMATEHRSWTPPYCTSLKRQKIKKGFRLYYKSPKTSIYLFTIEIYNNYSSFFKAKRNYVHPKKVRFVRNRPYIRKEAFVRMSNHLTKLITRMTNINLSPTTTRNAEACILPIVFRG